MPDQFTTLSQECPPKTAYPAKDAMSPNDLREHFGVRFRSLLQKKGLPQAVNQARNKRHYDKLVRPVNKALLVRECVYVDNHDCWTRIWHAAAKVSSGTGIHSP